jgi:hypothetical protein
MQSPITTPWADEEYVRAQFTKMGFTGYAYQQSLKIKDSDVESLDEVKAASDAPLEATRVAILQRETLNPLDLVELENPGDMYVRPDRVSRVQYNHNVVGTQHLARSAEPWRLQPVNIAKLETR